MKWNFIKYPAGMTIRDAMVGEFFSVDAIDKPAQALIREAIQNSLDARPNKDIPLTVRIFLGKITEPNLVNKWFDGAWEHYDADRRLENKPQKNEAISYLVFEDFGTTGLQGDIEQAYDIETVKNPFFYFFRAEGRSGKGEDDRGRWGVGKHVFADISRVKTFWGLTVRNDDKQHMLMGRAVLRSRLVGSDFYSPDGYFGSGDGFTLPLLEQSTIHQFSMDFNVSRKDESGLSVIVPFIDDDITFENIKSAVVEEYFYPILKGDLIVNVETVDKNIQINRETFYEINNNSLLIHELVNKSLDNFIDELFILNPCDPQRPAWTKDLIPTDMLLQMREKYQNGDIVAVQASLTVRPKSGKEQNSYFRVFFKQDKDESGRPVFIRSGLIVSRVKSPITRGVKSLVIIDDAPLVKLLGDSENPAHNEWQKRNIKDKYLYGSSYIEFVANIVSNLINALSVEENNIDENLLSDIFSLPLDDKDSPKRTTDDESKKPGDVPPPPPPPPPPPRESKFNLLQVKGGFSVKSDKEKVVLPAQLEILVAYDVRRGNPLKRYNSSDFKLNQSPIKIKNQKGLKIIKLKDNTILADVLSTEYELVVTGFDANRDLYVKVEVDDDKND